MIENRLTKWELQSLLVPFLRLYSVEEIISEFAKLSQVCIESLDDLHRYCNQVDLKYKDFSVHITGIGELAVLSTYVKVQFRLARKWQHKFKNPTKPIISDLQELCEREIIGIPASTYSTKEYVENTSAIIISPFENQEYFFVDFYFNSNCFHRFCDKTSLKENWESHVLDVSRYVSWQTAEILKYAGKNEHC